ncbi:hypothetical protein VTN02DRAFT_6460 [Thermoascus thermophilus]
MALDAPVRVLETLDPGREHTFAAPSKRIHDGADVATFLTSRAYRDLMTFILQLNRAMFPARRPDGTVQPWPLDSDADAVAVVWSDPVRRLRTLLSKLEAIIDEAPPDPGPRRFGNISFRKWYGIVESRAAELLEEALPADVLRPRSAQPASDAPTAMDELKAYFLGSFGSAQRLDYGTGHELSFVAFLACVWKLNGFPRAERGVEERGIVLGVIEPYLQLVRTLIRTYTLEPAGSHGVWGLDDHSFIPYIFGSAQLSPAISESDQTPVEGSLPDAPDPGGVAKADVVARERNTNMYFSAVGFIYDVKRGPFWEHSPMLYDISGVTAGWGKINKGMIKMYNAEVLSKLPVVQHFPFGSLLSWDRDPTAPTPPPAAHTAGPQARPTGLPRPPPEQGTRAPWATSTPAIPTRQMPSGPMAPTRAPWAQSQSQPPAGPGDPTAPTRAPWAKP